MKYFKSKGLLKVSMIFILSLACIGSIYASDSSDFSLDGQDSIQIDDFDDSSVFCVGGDCDFYFEDSEISEHYEVICLDDWDDGFDLDFDDSDLDDDDEWDDDSDLDDWDDGSDLDFDDSDLDDEDFDWDLDFDDSDLDDEDFDWDLDFDDSDINWDDYSDYDYLDGDFDGDFDFDDSDLDDEDFDWSYDDAWNIDLRNFGYLEFEPPLPKRGRGFLDFFHLIRLI